MSGPGIAVLGECMLELSPTPENREHFSLAAAGDTFNTAVALAQLGCKPEYLISGAVPGTLVVSPWPGMPGNPNGSSTGAMGSWSITD